MTDRELAAQAEAHLRRTTISYPEWVKRRAAGKYANDGAGTEWGKAFASLDRIGDTTVFEAPASIAADGSRDVTAALSSWLAGVPDGTVARLTAGGRYRTDGTVELVDRQRFTLDGNGATLRATTVGDGHRPNVRVRGGEGNTVQRLALDGGYTRPGVHDGGVQWSHGVEALGTGSLTLDDVAVTNVSGDGVYLGAGATPCLGTKVNRLQVNGTGRNGISLVAANDTHMQGGTLERVGYIGLDCEPNGGSGRGVLRATFDGVTVGDYFMSVGTIVGDEDVHDIAFRNIRVTAAKGPRLQVAATNGRRRRNVQIVGCSSANPVSTGSSYAIVASGVDGLTVTDNLFPGAAVLLSCSDVTGLVFSGNTPNTKTC